MYYYAPMMQYPYPPPNAPAPPANEEAPTAEESGWAMGTRLDEPSMSEILQWGVTPSASDWQSENRAEFKFSAAGAVSYTHLTLPTKRIV